MAKKKTPLLVGVAAEYAPPPMSDNNPDGPYPLPDDNLNGCRYRNGKVSFVDRVAAGESPNKGDVNMITANGVSSSRGQGKNCEYNWGESTDGRWGKNRDWKGANLTGM